MHITYITWPRPGGLCRAGSLDHTAAEASRRTCSVPVSCSGAAPHALCSPSPKSSSSCCHRKLAYAARTWLQDQAPTSPRKLRSSRTLCSLHEVKESKYEQRPILRGSLHGLVEVAEGSLPVVVRLPDQLGVLRHDLAVAGVREHGAGVVLLGPLGIALHLCMRWCEYRTEQALELQ
jgi:hypothetical protein